MVLEIVTARLAMAGIAATVGFARTAGALPEHFTIGATRALHRVGDVLTYPIPAADGAQIDREAQVILVRGRRHARLIPAL